MKVMGGITHSEYRDLDERKKIDSRPGPHAFEGPDGLPLPVILPFGTVRAEVWWEPLYTSHL